MLKKDFLIGADPEFLCIHNDQVVRAKNYVMDDDRFGMDGNGYTFEARPEPSTNPICIVNNIRRIFLKKITSDVRFSKYQWFSGAYRPQGKNDVRNFPLGGHIHFGIKDNLINYDLACLILDNYVGVISVLLEDYEQGLLRRETGDYGFASDYREQAYGFEYRTPSSWLSSPYISAGVLCLAKMVMYEALNNKKFSFITKNRLPEFDDMNRKSLMVDFPSIWKSITSMSLYKDYHPYLNLLNNLVISKKTWDTSKDIKETWGLFDTSTLIRDEVTVESVWKKFILNRA